MVHYLSQSAHYYLYNISVIINGLHTTRLILHNNSHIVRDHNLANPVANATAVSPAHDANNHLSRDARMTPGTIHPVNFAS
jgi:hypothetical protein